MSDANCLEFCDDCTYKSLLEAIFMNSRLRVERENNAELSRAARFVGSLERLVGRSSIVGTSE
jgi:hypothetical protein